jgi:hypothetical protein
VIFGTQAYEVTPRIPALPGDPYGTNTSLCALKFDVKGHRYAAKLEIYS